MFGWPVNDLTNTKEIRKTLTVTNCYSLTYKIHNVNTSTHRSGIWCVRRLPTAQNFKFKFCESRLKGFTALGSYCAAWLSTHHTTRDGKEMTSYNQHVNASNSNTHYVKSCLKCAFASRCWWWWVVKVNVRPIKQFLNSHERASGRLSADDGMRMEHGSWAVAAGRGGGAKGSMSSLSQILSSIVTLIPSGLTSRILTCTELF